MGSITENVNIVALEVEKALSLQTLSIILDTSILVQVIFFGQR